MDRAPAGCTCHSHGSFLTAKGLREAAQRERQLCECVDMWPSSAYLDKVGSVSDSGLSIPHWDDALIDEQHRRFHNEVEELV